MLDKYRPVTPSHLPLVYTCHLQNIAKTVSRCVLGKTNVSLSIFNDMAVEKDESDVIPDVSQTLGNGNPREGCQISKAIVKVLQVHQKES